MGKKIGLLTDWVTIAMEGKTIDGRNLDKLSFEEMAETYDPELYTAVINAEHWGGNYGAVRELKVGKNKFGVATLDARLEPEAKLINQDASFSKRKFFSIERWPNFRGSGKYYLTGLAITNTPASPGTSEINFETKQGEHVEKLSSVEFTQDSLNAINACFDNNNSADMLQKGIFAAITAAFKDVFKNNQNNNKNEDDEEMKPEELQAILDSNKAVSDNLAELNTTIKDKFSKPETNPPAATPPATPPAETNPPAETGNNDFNSKIADAMLANTKAVAEMAGNFAKLLGENPGGTKFTKNDTNGGGEQEFV